MSDTSTKIVTDALATEIIQNTKLHLNLSQDAIVITEDKVRLCLIEHLRRLEAKRDWIAPAGILATLAVTFTTTEFQDLFLPKTTWQAIFVVAAAVDAFWLLKKLWVAWNAPTVEDIVRKMKRAGAQEQANHGTPSELEQGRS